MRTMRRTMISLAASLLLGGTLGAGHALFAAPEVPIVAPAGDVDRPGITEDDPRWQCDAHGTGRCQPAGWPVARS